MEQDADLFAPSSIKGVLVDQFELQISPPKGSGGNVWASPCTLF
jgi:hypothetical protein